ncbi:MAG TPA: hypothetical protein VKT78_08435 [Fimbriimonadaceae bacterium]|nr:hypothetical protein [Fimbriimonadaceae bacterium]
MKVGVVFAVTLFVCAVLQQALAYRLAIFGARPDFMLVALSALGVFANRAGGMALGFFDGLIIGALSGANLQHYVASRTVTGLLLGWTSGNELPRSLPAVGVIAAVTTVFAQLVLMFLAPPHSIGSFLADTIRGAVYNGVLAIPVYALLKKLLAPVVR